MGVLLWILSLILSLVLLPVGIIFGLIQAIYKKKFFKTGIPNIDKKCLRLATGVDIFGNVACVELFNAVLITKDSKYKFGKHGETISEVIGYNLVCGTLTRTGKLLNSILDFIEKDHCLKAIQNKD